MKNTHLLLMILIAAAIMYLKPVINSTVNEVRAKYAYENYLQQFKGLSSYKVLFWDPFPFGDFQCIKCESCQVVNYGFDQSGNEIFFGIMCLIENEQLDGAIPTMKKTGFLSVPYRKPMPYGDVEFNLPVNVNGKICIENFGILHIIDANEDVIKFYYSPP